METRVVLRMSCGYLLALALLQCGSVSGQRTTGTLESNVDAPLKDDFLLLTQASKDGVMYQTSLDGTRVWRLPIYFGYKVVGVDYDPIDHKVYWIDESGVVASTLNGTRTLIHAMPRNQRPEDVVFDASEKLIFYTDSRRSTINLVHAITKRWLMIVHNTHTPRDLHLDRKRKKVYWTDWGMSAIEMSDYDGMNREVVVSIKGAGIHSVVIDDKDQKLYWVNSRQNSIQRSDLNGDKIEVLINASQVNTSTAQLWINDMATSTIYIYFTDKVNSGVYRVSKDEKKVEALLNITDVENIVIYQSANYMKTDDSRCLYRNGGCGGLCIPAEGAVRCKCEETRRLQKDGVTCSAHPTYEGPELIWLEFDERQTANIMFVHGDPKDYLRTLSLHPLVSIKQMWHWSAVDFDYDRSQLLLVDRYDWLLIVAPLTPDRKMRAVDYGISSGVDGICYDWVSGNVYWGDAHFNWIRVLHLETRLSAVVVDQLDTPHGVVVHPKFGYIYWADWGALPRIARATLTGKNRTIIVTRNLKEPKGLAIDYNSNTLYWADGETIGSIDLVTSARRVFGTNYNTQFTNVALYNDYMFATDVGAEVGGGRRTRPLVWFFNKAVHQANTTRPPRLPRSFTPYGITMYDQSRQEPMRNSCMEASCPQLCASTPSGPECFCDDRYTKLANNTCAVNIHNHGPMFVYALTDRVCAISYKVMHTNRHSNVDKYCHFQDPLQKLKFGPLAYDYRAGDIFLVESSKSVNRIYRARLSNLTNNKALILTSNNISAIAVDYVSGHLYWLDPDNGVLWMARTDGTFQTKLRSGLERPQALVVDNVNRKLFWTAHNSSGAMIMQANLNGSEARVFYYQQSSLLKYQSLAIDYRNERLYIVDGYTGYISNLGLLRAGANKRQYMERFKKATSVDVMEDFVVFTVASGNDYSGIMMVHKVSGVAEKPAGVLHGQQPTVGTVMAFYERNQPLYSTNVACAGDFDGDGKTDKCDQLCFSMPADKHQCGCIDGMTLAPNKWQCVPVGEVSQDDFLLIADDYLHRVYQVSEQDLSSPSAPLRSLALPAWERPIALAYDHVRGDVYWSDYVADVVQAMPAATGAAPRLVWDVPRGGRVDGLAFEPFSRLLYYTDVLRAVVGLMDYRGGQHKVLVTEGISRPQAIVLDSARGRMYFTNQEKNGNSSIMTATMDGVDARMIITRVRLPTGLAIDYKERRLFWVDGGTRTVESASLTGTGRRVLVSGALVANPFAIAATATHLYWTDWQRRGLYRMSRHGRSPVKVLRIDFFDGLNDVQYIKRSLLPEETSCSDDNGRCSHICVPIPNGRKCLCPDNADGAVLIDDDGLRCPLSTCNVTRFPGELQENCAAIGASCTFRCGGVFQPTITGPVRCTAGGYWSTPLDRLCRLDSCPMLTLPPHAVLTAACEPVSVHGDQCWFTCAPGYRQATGDIWRRCGDNGEWTGRPIGCLPGPDSTTPRPTTTAITPTVTTPITPPTTRATTPSGPDSTTPRPTTTAINPTVTTPITPPTTRATTPSRCPADFDTGQLSGSCTRLVGSACTFNCNVGYGATTSNAVVCLRSLKWNTPLNDLCTIRTCTALVTPDHAVRLASCPRRAAVGATCAFECIQGYNRVSGDATRRCGNGWRWTGAPLVCEVSGPRCALLPGVTFADVVPRPCVTRSSAVGDTCRFACRVGWQADDGDATRTCLQSALWSGEPFSCKRNTSYTLPKTGAIKSGGSNRGKVTAGILVPVLLLLIVVLVVAIFLFRRHKRGLPMFRSSNDMQKIDGDISPTYSGATGTVQLDGSFAFDNPVYGNVGMATAGGAGGGAGGGTGGGTGGAEPLPPRNEAIYNEIISTELQVPAADNGFANPLYGNGAGPAAAGQHDGSVLLRNGGEENA